MNNNLGDFSPGAVLGSYFNTNASDGTPTTIAGSPTICVYKDRNTTQSTAGASLVVDFDGVTGLHAYSVDTSSDPTFYANGSDFTIVLVGGTVSGISVAGTKVATFSLHNRSGFPSIQITGKV